LTDAEADSEAEGRKKNRVSIGTFFDRAFRHGFCFSVGKEANMEKRIAAISIIVENPESVEALNALLHEYSSFILGRMGIPYREEGVSIICVALDAPADTVNALTGKIGRLSGVSAKAVYSRSAGTQN
jgi:putative iron-only hydrogenase system regulator